MSGISISSKHNWLQRLDNYSKTTYFIVKLDTYFKKMVEDIYKLKLNENVELQDGTVITRVPGGWIYEMSAAIAADDGEYQDFINHVFVPYSDEFKVEPIKVSPDELLKIQHDIVAMKKENHSDTDITKAIRALKQHWSENFIKAQIKLLLS